MWDIARSRQAAGLELGRISGINEHGGTVTLGNIADSFKLDLRYPDESPPDGNAELVSPHVGVAGFDELSRESCAFYPKMTRSK